MSQIIIIPYFSEEEVDRYLRIADRFRSYSQQKNSYSFLLASSPKIRPIKRLVDCFSEIAPTTVFECPTQIFGYPQGPTAMFWDCMDYIANETPHDGGFSLWFESDMVPVKPDWIDRISDDWNSKPNPPVLMGIQVPKVTKKRFFRKPRLWIPEHINGGGCYSKDFGQVMPAEARKGVFDIWVYEFAVDMQRAYGTQTIGFATAERAKREISKPERVLLHGFMQEKDEFIETCMSLAPESVEPFQPLSPIAEDLEHAYRRFKLRFGLKRHQAMLRALQVRQDEIESEMRRAA